MQLTKESEYALLGMAALARRPVGAIVSLAEIAGERDLPQTFLAKIFQKLARAGVLRASRGRGSGYALSAPPDAITMREILEAVEGPRLFQKCLLWNGHCHDTEPCPLHFRLKELTPAIEQMLESLTLAEYIEGSGHEVARL